MVGRKRKSGPRLAGSHQRCWLWGQHAVMECLAAGRWRPLELRLSRQLDAAVQAAVTQLAREAEIPLEWHDAAELTTWCRSNEHQGLLARMPEYPYLKIEPTITLGGERPLFLVLDRLQDPHNFGAILRSAEVFGADAVFVGVREQSDVTPHVARSSAGAVNYLPIARAENLVDLIGRLQREREVRTLVAAGDGEAIAAECDLRQPTALIIGNEGTGVSAALRSAASGTIRIPQSGRTESLNAAVAAGVLLYEARRQRGE